MNLYLFGMSYIRIKVNKCHLLLLSSLVGCVIKSSKDRLIGTVRDCWMYQFNMNLFLVQCSMSEICPPFLGQLDSRYYAQFKKRKVVTNATKRKYQSHRKVCVWRPHNTIVWKSEVKVAREFRIRQFGQQEHRWNLLGRTLYSHLYVALFRSVDEGSGVTLRPSTWFREGLFGRLRGLSLLNPLIIRMPLIVTWCEPVGTIDFLVNCFTFVDTFYLSLLLLFQ